MLNQATFKYFKLINLVVLQVLFQLLFIFEYLFSSHTKEKHLDHSTIGISSGSPTVGQSTAKQCIFYPVKEEEGEIVEPQVNIQGTSSSEVLEERTGPCKINNVWSQWEFGNEVLDNILLICPFYQSVGGSPGLEECEVRIGCPQMEVHPNLYSSTEEGM